MTTIIGPAQRIALTEQLAEQARSTRVPSNSRVVIESTAGNTVELSRGLQEVLIKALQALAVGSEVSIVRIPEELTSTAAAELLGVSRPTLMKWARAGEVESFKVGSHTRFKRTEILRAKARLESDREKALAEFREVSAQMSQFMDEQ